VARTTGPIPGSLAPPRQTRWPPTVTSQVWRGRPRPRPLTFAVMVEPCRQDSGFDSDPHDSREGMASAMPPQLRFRFRPRRAQAHPNDQFRISQGTTKQRVPHVSCLSRRGSSGLHHPRPPNNCHLERSSFLAKRRSDAVERSPGAGEPNNAQGNSDKNPATGDDESAATAVILRQRSPWQNQGLPTKDLCTGLPQY
jgi:hypothetical protein